MILPVEKIDPSEIVVPIFGIDESSNAILGKYVFLGTGFFIDNPSFLVTADHVVRDWKQSLGITILSNPERIISAKIVKRDHKTDLALLEVSEYHSENALQLADDDEIIQNQLIYCMEYSTTWAQNKEIHLSPATRIGNVTRKFDLQDRYGMAGDEMLELSFPALRGASGAPIISGSFHVWGVIIATAEYHFLPVQIESVLDEKNQLIEETRFLLPQALAVHVKHIRALMQ
jgi:hypothetical protein